MSRSTDDRPARLLQVRAGRVARVPYRGREIATAFRKAVVEGPVEVTPTGLVGDEQADLRVHGGPDKALCVYPSEHYDAWAAAGTSLGWGDLGENLVTEGLRDDEVVLGERLRIGGVLAEVSMSRRPCFKIAAVHGRADLPDEVQATGRTGFYLRVLTPGTLTAGDEVVRVSAPARSVTVQEVNRVMNLDRDDPSAAAALVDLPTVPERWRRSLARRLEGRLDDDAGRLRPE